MIHARILSLSLCLGIGMASSAFSQEDTAHHRAVYEAVNSSAATMEKVTAEQSDEEVKFGLTGWFEGESLRKIVARSSDSASGTYEFYLEKNEPVFVFSYYQPVDDEGKKGAKVEERLYFKEGMIFKWLTTEKPEPVFHAEDYQATTELLLSHCKAFSAALLASRPAGQVLEGTFIGIDQGDYPHWNLRTADGVEHSYFVLKPDAAVEKVLEKPGDYQGKTCRVRWKKSKENLPEAGGPIEFEQLISVEWTKGE